MKTTTDTDPRNAVSRSGPDLGPTLTVVDAPAKGAIGVRRRVVPGQPIVLGRTPTCSLPGVFTESSVSRNHAKLLLGADGPVISDLGSRNGTTVNGVSVERQRLEYGDVIGVGDVLLLFHEAPAMMRIPRHPQLVGIGSGLAHVLEQIELVAKRTTTVVVVGETGTGKELVAGEIHRNSGRSGDLVSINCAGVDDNLLHSELFGHVRGAFTGAQRDRKGLIESARGGTLFLDEITDASPSFQASLLRLFETGEYRPVGSDRPLRADVRFVAAVQPRVHQAVEDGRFRLDLWSRLARWVIKLPALNRRTEDVPALTRHFVRRYAGRDLSISPELLVSLMGRGWRGNVRELQGVVERLVVASRGAPELDLAVLATLELDAVAPMSTHRYTPTGSAPEAPATAPQLAGQRKKRVPRPGKAELEATLAAEQGNIRSTAASLGVTRKTLYRWLQSHGIDVEAFRTTE